jgi:hypothetical protein
MSLDTVTPILYLFSGLLVMLGFHLVVQYRLRVQQEIIRRGTCIDGKVTAICGGATKRVYFEFSPPGSELPLQCCHIDRLESRTLTSLPTPGTLVQIRYLPENPRHAVITRVSSG